MGEIRQANFRIDTDAAEKFRAFCEEQGLNQAQGFDHIMQVLELDRAKQLVPNRQTEISDFEMHAKALLGAFLQSVRLNEDAEARIREQFAGQLISKDQSIADYQLQLQGEKGKVADLEARVRELLAAVAEIDSLREELAKAVREKADTKAQHEKQLSDKDSIVTMLSEKLTVAEKKAQGFDELKAAHDGLAADLKAAQEAAKEQQKDFDLQLERASRAAEKAQEGAVSAVRAEAEKTISELRAQLQQAQIDAERQLRAADKEAAAEIRKLEQDNAALREQLAELRAKMAKKEG